MGLEAAYGHAEAGLAENLDGAVHQRLRLLGRGGLGEAGTAALARAAVEGELADDEKLGAGVEGRAVELALGVVEDAQVGYLVGYVAGLFLTVAAADAEEDDEAAADLGNAVAIHGDGGAGYALDECPQELPPP